MAALNPPSLSRTPVVLDEVLGLPVSEIDVGERLRPVDPVHAEALAALMARDGQDTPIEVCRLPGSARWLLVTGGHRLAGAQLLAWTTIKAIVVGADRAERRRREVSENLFRRDLAPIDRAAFVAELYDLEKARAGLAPTEDPRTAGANVRWAKAVRDQADDATATIAVAYGFTDQVALSVGLSARTIRDDLTLHRGLPAAIVAQIRGLPLASNAGQLRALAKMADADQRGVVALLLEGKAKTPADALGLLHQRPKPDMEKKAWSAFLGGWSRMTPRRKREALRELQGHGLPKGVRIVFDGDADA